MSLLEAEYREFDRGFWAEKRADRCPCRGHGWACSDLDTWHRCPVHYDGQRHPEDDRPEELEAPVDVIPVPVAPVGFDETDDLPF